MLIMAKKVNLVLTATCPKVFAHCDQKICFHAKEENRKMYLLTTHCQIIANFLAIFEVLVHFVHSVICACICQNTV